jgi:hypothetical protein
MKIQYPFIKTLLYLGLVMLAPGTLIGSGVYDVRDFGAKGDGRTLDTVAIQSAIDKASEAGGGRVALPPGIYLSGSLHLKSHIEFFIDQGATLLGSASLSDYVRGKRCVAQSADGQEEPTGEDSRYALLLAHGQEDMTLSGEGTINGQGRALALDVLRRIQAGEIASRLKGDGYPNEEARPSLIDFCDCRKVKVTGVTLRDASCWTEIYANCEDLVVEGIHVHSAVYWNADGIDIVDCKRVRMSHCDIYSEDDALCLKSESGGGGCEDVDVSDCRVCSIVENAFKLGTSGKGGFRNIHASNLTVDNTRRSAIALESVDGGALENVLVENVHGTNTGNAIFLRLGHRNPHGAVGQLQDVIIRNVSVEISTNKTRVGAILLGWEPDSSSADTPEQSVCPSSIVGLPGYPVRNVRLENVTIIYPGVEVPDPHYLRPDKLNSVPELPAQYPEFWMFRKMPAWGFYVRHAEGIQFSNVNFILQKADLRPAMVFDDVSRVGAEQLTVSSTPHNPVLVMQDVQGASFTGLNLPATGRRAVKIQGNCGQIEGIQNSP